ncbi:MAG: serine/threonine protein kinase [Phycisphaerae bacterium]|nr:serine/threonine protein kinase [Phycisphaerae bacterium]
MSDRPETIHDSNEIEDPADRSAFGFDQDDTWLAIAARADATPHLGRLGDYELISEAGRGGQGTVYQAIQPGTGRTVAIKRLGAGRFASPGMRARFDREIRVLASLNHPGVVTIHGADEVDGHRFLLMEWIEGTPIDAWARCRPIRERLAAFAGVCDAVAHAHQRGVIHRDLKPSNILVDGTGRPRVLDFGLATLREEAEQDSGQTAPRTASFVGTPAYAAPEQLSGTPDTRTDVYALGGVLYRMLTDHTPLEPADDLPTLFEAIRSAEPRPPSARVRGLDADLDSITLRALAKEPDRRYPSVDALADDVRRYLDGLPVNARPPSGTYRLRKFVRRHRLGVAAALATALALGSFSVHAAWQSGRYARLARDEHLARLSAEASQREAIEGRSRANRESARAAAVMEFLLETLSLANPDVAPVQDLGVRDMLDRAAEGAGDWFRGQPEAEAHVRGVLGRAYAAIGALREAEAELARSRSILESLGGVDPRSLYAVLWPYAHVLADLAERDWWEHWSRLDGLLATIARDPDPRFAEAISGLRPDGSDDAVRMDQRIQRCREAVAAMLAPTDPRWLDLGDALYLAGRPGSGRASDAQARVYLRASLDVFRQHAGPTHSRTVQALDALTRALIREGRFADAEALIRESIERLSSTLAPDHWFIAVLESRLGLCMLDQGRIAESAALMQRSLPRIVAAQGWTYRPVRETLVRLARAYDTLARPDLARAARRDLAGAMARASTHCSSSLAREALTGEHEAFWTILRSLHRELAAGSDKVPGLLDRVLAERRARFPDDDEYAGMFVDQMFPQLNGYINAAGFDEHSLEAYRELLRICRVNTHLHVDKRAGGSFWVSWNLEHLGQHVEGEALARESIDIGRHRHARSYGRGGITLSLLGGHLLGQGRHDEAEPWLLDGLDALWSSLGAADGNTHNAWDRVVALYAAWERSERLVPILRRLIDSNPPANDLIAWGSRVLVRPRLTVGAYHAAFDAISAAAGAAPIDFRLLSTLGMAHLRLGRHDVALAHLRRADGLRGPETREPSDTIALKGLAHLALGDREGARSELRRANAQIDAGDPSDAGRRLRDELQRELDGTR